MANPRQHNSLVADGSSSVPIGATSEHASTIVTADCAPEPRLCCHQLVIRLIRFLRIPDQAHVVGRSSNPLGDDIGVAGAAGV